MRIKYSNKTMASTSMRIVDAANDIITEYSSQGFVLTLRQLYYQFVARDFIENTERSYKRLGVIVSDGRLCGHIDWDAIEDRGRLVHEPQTWDSPAEIVQACADSYKINLWEGQKRKPEVWIEKEALLSVAQQACLPFRTPVFACKGYVSQSAMWDAGRNRLRGYVREGHVPVIIHLGDHDPSGIDMTRDIADRLSLFAQETVDVQRVALNMDQVGHYEPPPNPAKVTDSRFREYQVNFGDESWELDALTPPTLVKIIQDKLVEYVDQRQWDAMEEREEEEREQLVEAAKRIRP